MKFLCPNGPSRWLIALFASLPYAASWAASDWHLGRGRWTGTLVLGYNQSGYSGEFDGRSLTGSNQNLQEILNVQGNNLYVLDPRLVRFDLGLNLAHNQNSYASMSKGDRSEGGTTDDVLGYNLNADLLSSKPYPATIYANRTHTQTSQNFGGLTKSTNENRGFGLKLKEESFLNEWGGPWFSAQLDASQSRGQSTSSYFNRTLSFDQSSQSVSLSANKGFTTSDLRFYYRAYEYSSALRGRDGTDLSMQNARVNYAIDFGPGLNRSLSSNLAYSQVQDIDSNSTFSLTENLHINHYTNLSSDTSYSYTREDNEGLITVYQDGSYSVTHTLYQNLTTSAFLNANQRNLPAGTTSNYSAGLSQSYHHGLPRGGSIGLMWSGSYQRNSNALASGVIPITGERHTAPPAADPGFLLDKPFVMLESIKVFNVKEGVRELLPADAYTLSAEGNRVRIKPVYLDLNAPNPVVKPGDELAVDYTFQIDARLESEGRDLSYGINLGYGWIAGGYHHDQSSSIPLSGEGRFLSSSVNDSVNVSLQANLLGMPWSASASHSRSISSGYLVRVLEDTTRLSVDTSGRVFGMDAQGNASMARYRATKLGYDQQQISATLLWRPYPSNWSMSFGANANRTQYLLPERQTSAMSARGSIDWDANRGWVNSAIAEVRSNDNGDSARLTALRLGGRTSFSLGKLTLSSALYVDYLTSGASRFNSQNFFVTLTRRF